MNVAKISLFLISLYLVAIFSAKVQILQKTALALTFWELSKPGITSKTFVIAKCCNLTSLVFNRIYAIYAPA